MEMHLFYTPQKPGDVHQLNEQESRHAARVLRLKTGDPAVLVDGMGGWYTCRVVESNPKKCVLQVLDSNPAHAPLPYRLHIAISPTRNTDRFEWFLEKATEIGITEITPLVCHRTERSRLNMERLDRILVSAMKQSLKAYKPLLHEASNMEKFLGTEHSGTLCIAHCIDAVGDGPTTRHGIHQLSGQQEYTLLVGPEGDFTEDEVMTAVQAGYRPVHLGTSRLRTETAGVYICAAINLLSQD